MYVSPWMQAGLLPQRWRVAGLTLPPLSVWAHYMVRSVGNPYYHGGDTDKDAAAEVLIYASMTRADSAMLYIQPRRRKRLYARMRRLLGRQPWDRVDAAVAEYITECCRVPSHKVRLSTTKKGEPKSEPLAAPFEWVLAEYMAGSDPARIEAAWDAPYATACCMFDAMRNATGLDSTLIDEAAEKRIDEREERKRAAEQESEAA